jgi:transcriptional regulator with PAS, ATPase and Fis domain
MSSVREPEAIPPLQQSEANAIRVALGRNQAHQGRAAEELGISRSTLWHKMNKHAIRAADFRTGRAGT